MPDEHEDVNVTGESVEPQLESSPTETPEGLGLDGSFEEFHEPQESRVEKRIERHMRRMTAQSHELDEKVARLEGMLGSLEQRAAPQDYTPAYASNDPYAVPAQPGDVDVSQRLGRIEQAISSLAQRNQQAEAQAAEAAMRQEQAERLEAVVNQYPDIKKPDSPLRLRALEILEVDQPSLKNLPDGQVIAVRLASEELSRVNQRRTQRVEREAQKRAVEDKKRQAIESSQAGVASDSLDEAKARFLEARGGPQGNVDVLQELLDQAAKRGGSQ